uniref:non-specific serine/threonine protein kinase n=1 Tax=Strongyloides papillosus TaxID=174720 RepID=A0A0N5C4G0_STREA
MFISSPTGFCGKKDVYHNKQLIAIGSFSEIYKCLSKKNGVVALKIEKSNCYEISSELLFYHTCLEQNDVEANFSSFLAPVPYILDEGMLGDKKFIVLPLYSSTLSNYIKEYKENCVMSSEEVRIIIKQLLQAISYLSIFRVSHNDIKGDNIMLRFPQSVNAVVLVDFNSASFIYEKNTSPVSIIQRGTPAFCGFHYHEGELPTFKSDLTSIVFNGIYWLLGELPWTSTESDIYKSKMSFLKNPSMVFNKLKIKEKNLIELIWRKMLEIKGIEVPNYHNILEHIDKIGKIENSPIITSSFNDTMVAPLNNRLYNLLLSDNKSFPFNFQNIRNTMNDFDVIQKKNIPQIILVNYQSFNHQGYISFIDVSKGKHFNIAKILPEDCGKIEIMLHGLIRSFKSLKENKIKKLNVFLIKKPFFDFLRNLMNDGENTSDINDKIKKLVDELRTLSTSFILVDIILIKIDMNNEILKYCADKINKIQNSDILTQQVLEQ